MNLQTCLICGRDIDGIWISHKLYLDKVFTLDQYKVGFQCHQCGACICTAGKKEDHPYGRISLFKKEKFRCPQCREVFDPSHVILRQDAPINVELRKILGETGPAIEAFTYNQISGSLDKRKWRSDKNIREQLLEQLKNDGNGYMYRCLEELVWEIEQSPGRRDQEILQSDAKNRLARVKWLAEIGAVWFFEDGKAEDILVYIFEHMQDHIRPLNENSMSEHPASIFDNLLGALYQVATVTKSGKSIPALINTLHNDETIYYRRIAAFALGQIDSDPRVVDALIKALQDEKRPFRSAGGSLLTPNAVSVQERAVLSLLEIGAERGLAAVIPVVGKSVKFADFTDIEYSGKDSVILLAEIGKIQPQLLIDALNIRDKDALRKDVSKNVNELTIISQIEKALELLNY